MKGIIFDYGGTIDSRGEHWSEVIWRGWQLAGLRVDKDTFRDCYVHGERYLAAHPMVSAADNFRQLLVKKINAEMEKLRELRPDLGIDDESINDKSVQIADYCDLSARECVEEARLVLEVLHSRYPLCLVSNFYGNIASVLQAYDLRRYFPHIIESAVVGVRKPDPRIFTLGCVALGLEPRDVLVVGDSLRKDILPAESIGCSTAWLKGKGWTAEEDAATHPSQISSLCELVKNEE